MFSLVLGHKYGEKWLLALLRYRDMEIGNQRKLITFLFIVWLQKISIPAPQRAIGNSEEEGYEPELEFPEGWGVETKTSFRGGSMDIC